MRNGLAGALVALVILAGGATSGEIVGIAWAKNGAQQPAFIAGVPVK